MGSCKPRVSIMVQDLMGPVVKVDTQISLRTVAPDMLERQVEAVVVVDAAGEACGLLLARPFWSTSGRGGARPGG
jgi:CBS domain-containing protein